MSNRRPTSAQLAQFGKALFLRRTELGRSQLEIATATGVSPAAVSRWELGYHYPLGGYIEPLIQALGWSTYEFNKETGFGRPWGGEIVPAPTEPLIMRSTPRYAWLIGSPTSNGGLRVRGADPEFKVTVYAPVNDRDTMELAWMESLLDTAEKFSVNMPAALVDMLEKNPEWEAVNGWPVPIYPDL